MMKKTASIIIALAMILPMLLNLTPIFAAAPTDSLEAFYDFEDDFSDGYTTDVTGNGHNGQFSGTAASKTVEKGKALYLDGSSAVKVPYDPKLSFDASESYTLSIWLNPDSDIGLGYKMICGNGRSSQYTWHALYYTNGAVVTSVSEDWREKNTIERPIGSAPSNSWTHIVLVYDASAHKLYGYVNGRQSLTTDCDYDTSVEGHGFNMGWSEPSYPEYFKGQLDNVRIYSKALSEAEVTALNADEKGNFVAGTNPPPSGGETPTPDEPVGLKVHYTFESEIENGIVSDASGSGLFGEISGTTVTKPLAVGNALYLNGASALKIPYTPSLSFDATESYTVSIWFNVDSDIGSGYKTIYGNGRSSQYTWNAIYYKDGEVLTSISEDWRKKDVIEKKIGSVSPGTWNHVVMIYDAAAGKLYAYLNGEKTVTADCDHNTAVNGHGFNVGLSEPSDPQYFKGQVDSIRVYNKALTGEEVADINTLEKDAYVPFEVTDSYVKYEGSFPDPTSGVPNVIFDSDCGPDWDDAGALAMLHTYEQQGKVKILAMMCSTSCEYGAPWLDAVNTYFGRPDIPLGTLKSKTGLFENQTYFTKPIVHNWENDTYSGNLVPDAVKVYRKTLAAAADNSVTIIVTGMLTNISDLLNSAPDEYSNLSGIELVKKKVKLLSVMGGSGKGETEWNVQQDIRSAQNVVDNCPAPIVFAGYEIGDPIITGDSATLGKMEADNPIRYTYTQQGSRNSWDLAAVLYAVEGLGKNGAYWDILRCDLKFSDDGASLITQNNTTGARAFLVAKASTSEMAKVLNALLSGAKKKNTNDDKSTIVDIKPSASGVTVGSDFTNDSGAAPYVYGESYYFGYKKDAKITVTFKGVGIEVFAGKNNDNGIVNFYVDGKLVQAVDLYTSGKKISSMSVFKLGGLENKSHTLEIVISGEKNSKSLGTFAAIDFVKVYSKMNWEASPETSTTPGATTTPGTTTAPSGTTSPNETTSPDATTEPSGTTDGGSNTTAPDETTNPSVTDPSDTTKPENGSDKKKNNTVLPIVLGISALVIAAGAVGAVFYFKKKK